MLRPKIAIFPISGISEFLMFEKSVIKAVDLKTLEQVLFIRLHDLLHNIHGDNRIPIWGVASGARSSEANKWNSILENDVAFFAKGNKLIGYATVKSKFQSENVAHELWSEFAQNETRQYLFTLQKYYEINSDRNSIVDAICRKGKFQFNSLQIIDNQYSLELLEALGIELIESKTSSLGQGFGLTASEKKVVEKHAVKMAIDYLSNLGYTEIVDVGDTESFDLRASTSGKHLNVEVKGSTGSAKSVMLTKNEVNFQKNSFPFNGLFVLSNIELTRGESISAQGGDINFISPWLIEESSLKAISYEYII